MKQTADSTRLQHGTPDREERSYIITGMDCPTCALTIEKGVAQIEGIQDVEVLYSTQKLKVSGEFAEQDILSRVRELGYEITTDRPEFAPAQPEPRPGFVRYVWQRKDARLFLLGLLFILPGLVLNELLGIHHLLIDLSSIIALAAAGFPVFRSAWKSVRFSREININVLMSIAGIGAVLIGAFTEAGMVMVLFLLGEIIEGYTGERTRDAIRSLINLVPSMATKITSENQCTSTQQIPVDALQVGDHILVKPGEKIPMDGRVLEGAASVNQASITGESRPVDKAAGSQVFASSINGEGALVIEVTHRAADNTISRLIRMVEEAQEKRAPAQRFVDRFARVYTPLVVMIALLVAVVPPIFFQQPLLNPDENTFGWLYRGLALLVVACPCALVISTPVSIISAISNAARNGLLIKGGFYLEEMRRVKAFAFDKTGTLTEGKPRVISLRSAHCVAPEEVREITRSDPKQTAEHFRRCESCAELVAVAGALEEYSEHPLADAIVQLASQNNLLKRYPVRNVSALVGRGIQGKVNGTTAVIGSHRYFDENYPHLAAECENAEKDALRGRTPLMVNSNSDFLGTLTLGDTVRSSSRDTLAKLKRIGINTLIMLTGDEMQVARGIASKVGVDAFHAQLMPGEKVEAVRSIQERYGKTVMVGDGINDAPALAAADVGIAMGSAQGGTAQAMETGDITLMSDNLDRLVFLLHLSKSTMNTIYFNVVFSILIKVVFFFLVIAGYGTMWMAVIADMGTSLFVTVNGMRLLHHPRPSE